MSEQSKPDATPQQANEAEPLPTTRVELIAAGIGELAGVGSIVSENIWVFRLSQAGEDGHREGQLRATIAAEQHTLSTPGHHPASLAHTLAADKANLHNKISTTPQPLSAAGQAEHILGIFGGIVVAPILFGIASAYIHRAVQRHRAK